MPRYDSTYKKVQIRSTIKASDNDWRSVCQIVRVCSVQCLSFSDDHGQMTIDHDYGAESKIMLQLKFALPASELGLVGWLSKFVFSKIISIR